MVSQWNFRLLTAEKKHGSNEAFVVEQCKRFTSGYCNLAYNKIPQIRITFVVLREDWTIWNNFYNWWASVTFLKIVRHFVD